MIGFPVEMKGVPPGQPGKRGVYPSKCVDVSAITFILNLVPAAFRSIAFHEVVGIR